MFQFRIGKNKDEDDTKSPRNIYYSGKPPARKTQERSNVCYMSAPQVSETKVGIRITDVGTRITDVGARITKVGTISIIRVLHYFL